VQLGTDWKGGRRRDEQKKGVFGGMRFAEALFECTQLAFLNPKGSAFYHDDEAQDDVQVLLHTLSDGCVAVRAPSARPSTDQHTTCGVIVCRRRTGRPFSRGQTPASQKRSPSSSGACENRFSGVQKGRFVKRKRKRSSTDPQKGTDRDSGSNLVRCIRRSFARGDGTNPPKRRNRNRKGKGQQFSVG